MLKFECTLASATLAFATLAFATFQIQPPNFQLPYRMRQHYIHTGKSVWREPLHHRISWHRLTIVLEVAGNLIPRLHRYPYGSFVQRTVRNTGHAVTLNSGVDVLKLVFQCARGVLSGRYFLTAGGGALRFLVVSFLLLCLR